MQNLSSEKSFSFSICFMVWLLLTAGMTFSYVYVFLKLGSNADNAIVLLMAHDILAGNVWLKSWTVGSANFYTLDILWYALGIKIFGFKPALLYYVPALSYGLVGSTSAAITFTSNHSPQKYFSLIICLFLLAFPTTAIVWLINFHILTTLYILITFWLVAYTQKPSTYCFAFLLLLLSNIGDPLSYFVGNISLVLAAIAYMPKNKKWKIIILAFGSLLLSIIIKKIMIMQGLTLVPANTHVVSFEAFGANIAYTFFSLLSLFNANIFGQSLLSFTTVVEMCYGGILFMGVILGVRFFKNIRLRPPPESARTHLLALLIVASLLDIFSTIFAAQFQGSLRFARYLFPAFIFLSIFIAAELPSMIKHVKGQSLLFFLLLFLSGSVFYLHTKKNIDITSGQRLAVEQYLLSHHLTNGYGSYWDTHNFTVDSLQAIKIRPVVANAQHEIGPFQLYTKKTWYASQPKVNFLIFDNSGWAGIDLTSATKTFGKPDHIVSIEGYTILIWNKNIAPELLPWHA